MPDRRYAGPFASAMAAPTILHAKTIGSARGRARVFACSRRRGVSVSFPFVVLFGSTLAAGLEPPEPAPPPVRELVHIVPLDDAARGKDAPLPETPPAPPHRPIGDVRGLFTTDDYPARALALEHQGTVVAKLKVDAAGRVEKCSIRRSSGHDDLDGVTCAILRERARFEPARDRKGRSIRGDYTTPPIRWEMPRRDPHPMTQLDRRTLVARVGEYFRKASYPPYRTYTRFGEGGRIEACRHEQGPGAPTVRPCAMEYQLMHYLYSKEAARIPAGTTVLMEGSLVDVDHLPDRAGIEARYGEDLLVLSTESDTIFPLLRCLSPEGPVEPSTCADRVLGASGEPAQFAVTQVRRLAPEEVPEFTDEMVR